MLPLDHYTISAARRRHGHCHGHCHKPLRGLRVRLHLLVYRIRILPPAIIIFQRKTHASHRRHPSGHTSVTVSAVHPIVRSIVVCHSLLLEPFHLDLLWIQNGIESQQMHCTCPHDPPLVVPYLHYKVLLSHLLFLIRPMRNGRCPPNKEWLGSTANGLNIKIIMTTMR